MINNQNDLVKMLNKMPYNDCGDCLIDFSGCGCETDVYVSQVEIWIHPGDMTTFQSLVEFCKSGTHFYFLPGTYIFKHAININKSRIVFQGVKDVIFKFHTEKHLPAISIATNSWYSKKHQSIPIKDSYVPVGKRELKIPNSFPFKIGDDIRIARYGNKDWIKALGMDNVHHNGRGIEWIPFYLEYDRIITHIHKTSTVMTITINEDIPCAIDVKWGGGLVYKYINSRIHDVYIKNISMVLDTTDDVSTKGIFINNARNIGLYDIKCHNFDKFIHVDKGSIKITVENCVYHNNLAHAECNEAFFLAGQLTIFHNCKVFGASKSFLIDTRVPGPNVVKNCSANNMLDYAEPKYRWATGLLFEGCQFPISLQNRHWNGWNSANCIVWNNNGDVCCQSPPFAFNMAIGVNGRKMQGTLKKQQDGVWYSIGSNIEPISLVEYQKQIRQG